MVIPPITAMQIYASNELPVTKSMY